MMDGGMRSTQMIPKCLTQMNTRLSVEHIQTSEGIWVSSLHIENNETSCRYIFPFKEGSKHTPYNPWDD